MRILVISSNRTQRDGIAEYTRQVFNPDHTKETGVEFTIEDVSCATILKAGFTREHVVHVQHEYFMFDRLAGASALFYFPYLWLMAKLRGFGLVTTFHSTYNVDNLKAALPHFQKLGFLFPLGRLYLRLHTWLVVHCSNRVLILSKVGMENMARCVSAQAMQRKVRYTHLGNYASCVRMQSHGLLPSRFGVQPGDKLFTLFGFAFPIKGYEYAIEAMHLLVNRDGRRDVKLFVVSGETFKASFPGGGQGGSYIGQLKELTRQWKLENYVHFTGYLDNHDPVLEEIFAESFCFLFPYLDRNFPSGAISTVLATNKPVLVTKIQCFREYEGLLMFEEKSAASLAESMLAALSEPGFSQRASAITRHNSEAFRMDRIFARHLEVYREALAKRG